MAFSHKQIAVTFDLGSGNFGESGFNRVKLSGPLRASVDISEAGGPSHATCQARISGMTLSNMNALSTLGIRATIVRRNRITIEAGDVTNGLGVVFQGQIIDGWADFSGMPEVTFYVSAGSAYLQRIKPIPPTSYNGLADVATIMQSLATQNGMSFQNYGVTSKLIDPYFPGTIHEQMDRCATAANINWFIINDTSVAIWPKGGSRGQSIPIISPDTGMIGYPTFTQSGVQINMLHTPSIGFGQKIQVKSSIPGASKVWQIQGVSHNLESETPNGQWSTRVTAVEEGLFAQGGVITQ